MTVHYCPPDEYRDKLTSEWVPGSRNNKQGPLSSSLGGRIGGAGPKSLPPPLAASGLPGSAAAAPFSSPESAFQSPQSWGHFIAATASPSDRDE